MEARCPSCGLSFSLTPGEVDAALVVEVLPELGDLGGEDLDALEAAAVTIVRLRFQARRRALAKQRAPYPGSRAMAVPYDGDPNLAPVTDEEAGRS